MEMQKPDSPPSDPARVDLAKALTRLESLTDGLRRYGLWLAIFTATTIAGGSSLAFFRVFPVLPSAYLVTIAAIGVSALNALFYSVTFESRRKEGDALFKEISDELQWYIRFERAETSKTASSAPEHRPDLGARLTLRTYAQTSDLPLIPGAYGPLLYALINIVSVAIAALSSLPFLGKS
jgi:hypothetical protein